MAWIVGVDVGGTFTDFSAREVQSGRSVVRKRPSTPDDSSRAILLGFEELMESAGFGSEEVERFAHGTTVATNALLQQRGGSPAVVTTKGFRDLLEIGRQARPRIYDLQADLPPPLAPRHRRIEIDERVGPDGTIIKAPSDADIEEVVRHIRAMDDIDGCAVCLLFSFLNPENEQNIKNAIKAACPDLHVTASSDVQPEFREFERFSTTVINSFLQPEVSRYMDRLKQEVTEKAPQMSLGIFQSSGGLMSVDKASDFPVRTALSGPAAGIIGAVATAKTSGIANVITLDMGGTSTDVCLIEDGQASSRNVQDIAGFRIRIPMLDINTVGAGGGSIAAMGADGLLKVGPGSAGAVPGPACYNRGGTEPTVSDANLLLGRLPEKLIGGEMSLDRELARSSVGTLGESLGLSEIETAAGIIGVVTSNMVRAIRTISVERGYDPRHFALMPFGGAGGLHAADVARELGMSRIIVPKAPGILCAEGLIVADQQESFVRTCRIPLDGPLDEAQETYSRLSTKAEAWFRAESAAKDQRRLTLSVEMRYIGQNYELPVSFESDHGMPELPAKDALRQLFWDAHERTYGHHDPQAPVEIVNLRLKAVAKLSHSASRVVDAKSNPQPADTSEVWFSTEKPVKTAVYARETLPVGFKSQGPAIITQTDATTVVPPEGRFRVDQAGNIIVDCEA